jgi:hypothetical protein
VLQTAPPSVFILNLVALGLEEKNTVMLRAQPFSKVQLTQARPYYTGTDGRGKPKGKYIWPPGTLLRSAISPKTWQVNRFVQGGQLYKYFPFYQYSLLVTATIMLLQGD